MNTRPPIIPSTHTWVSEATASALGLDPDTLPVSIAPEIRGTWPPINALQVQIPRRALDEHFAR